MKRSMQRILTTHTGSLPRPDDLLVLIKAREEGKLGDPSALYARARSATADIVRAQTAAGVDVVNDGEQGKSDYSTYIKDRFSGYAGGSSQRLPSREAKAFPDFAALRGGIGPSFVTRPICVGPIAWKDFAAVEREIDDLKAAKAACPAEDFFMTSVSPGQASRFLGNEYYPGHEAYIRALGAVLHDEYTAIARAGFVLQVDCPDLGSGWNSQFPDLNLGQFRKMVELHLEVLDEATRDVPPEQLRLHLCWGNYNGPHTEDIPLREIIAPVLKSRATAISFEGANPRHEHEWKLWKDVKLPPGKLLIPGVLDSTSNFVEHPEVVADRICRYASVVGRENVIAGTDCGFGTFAGRVDVFPSVVWAKLRAMAEGAKLATQQLWG